ncbi:Hypothetical protein SMAX5B_002014 [Scophthalmus maximus]|nr:Hypothetical protein SMAX5B_002014 [Scophthalmus maximus]
MPPLSMGKQAVCDNDESVPLLLLTNTGHPRNHCNAADNLNAPCPSVAPVRIIAQCGGERDSARWTLERC